MRTSRSSRVVLASVVAIPIGLTWLDPVWAQGATGALTPYATNDVQRPTAVAIEPLCPSLPAPVTLTPSSTGQERLGNSCTKLVATGLGASGNPFYMGLSASQMSTSLQAYAPEEMSAQNRVSTMGGGRNPINGRLLALRGGGRGVLYAGSSINLNGNAIGLAQLLPEGARGGGAAADSGLGGRWGGFLNGTYNFGDRDTTGREDGFSYDDWSITGGVDYRFTDSFVAGLAVSAGKTKSDFDNNLGDVESTNFGGSAYASYTIGNLYIDGHFGYAQLDFDTTRRIFVPSMTATAPVIANAIGETDGSQYTLSVGAGYDFRGKAVSVTPYARIDYLKLEVDGFVESEPVAGLAINVNSRDTKSLQSALGARLWQPISTEIGVVTPYAGVEWNHEYKNDSGSLVARFVNDPLSTTFVIPTDDPDRNFFTLSAGASAVFRPRLSAFVNVDTVVGLSKTTSTGITVGVRGEF
jgi:outer membrane autotransporter protein